MKVGILTFSKSINYGATLQATALKHTLTQLGADATMIDHPCAMIDSSSKVFDFSRALSFKYTAPHIVNMPIAIKRTQAFRRFWKSNFDFGSDNPKNYDMIIAGSDQVWNYNLTGDDMFYFLDFDADVKKVSYAASFGISEIDSLHRNKIAPLLNDFDAISVRETTGAGLVRQLIGKDVPATLDPTLLFDKARWSEYADRDFNDKGYIFVYTVFNSEPLWQFAYELSQKTGLPIRTISYSKFHRHRATYSFSAGPDTWISHVMNADYVVTNSFHGFAFSVNFQKQFYFEMPPKSSGVGLRIGDMAKEYGLLNRDITVADTSPIDYSEITPKLEQARKKSLDFLKDVLNTEE